MLKRNSFISKEYVEINSFTANKSLYDTLCTDSINHSKRIAHSPDQIVRQAI